MLTKHFLHEAYLNGDEEQKMTKEDNKSFLEAVANYHKLGEMIYSNAKLQEVTETLKSVMERAEKISLALISGAERTYIDIFKKSREKELSKGKYTILEENILQEEFELFDKFGGYMLSQVVQSVTVREMLDKKFKNVNYSTETSAFLPSAKKNFVGYTFFKYEVKSLTGIKQMSVPRMGVSQIWKKKYIINRPDINAMITEWYKINDNKEQKKKGKEISGFVKNFIKEEMAPPT